MKITFKASELKQHLPLLLAASERKNSIPILKCLCIDVAQKTISATDLDNYVSVQFAVSFEPGVKDRITVPAKQFTALVQGLADAAEISVSALKNNRAEIKAANYTVQMTGMNASNWPTFPATPADYPLLVPSEEIARLIGKTAFCTAREEPRYVPNGALLEMTDGYLKMVATDGHRLAVVRTKEFNFQEHKAQPFRFVIRESALELIAQAQPQEFSIGIVEQEGWLHFSQGSVHIASRGLFGQFPNYQTVIPKALATATVKVSRDALKDAVVAATPFLDQRTLVIHLKIGDGKLFATAQNVEHGNFSAQVKAETHSENIDMCFNSLYIAEFLDHVDGEVEMEFRGQHDAGLFRSVADGSDYVYIVMPMRT